MRLGLVINHSDEQSYSMLLVLCCEEWTHSLLLSAARSYHQDYAVYQSVVISAARAPLDRTLCIAARRILC